MGYPNFEEMLDYAASQLTQPTRARAMIVPVGWVERRRPKDAERYPTKTYRKRMKYIERSKPSAFILLRSP